MPPPRLLLVLCVAFAGCERGPSGGSAGGRAAEPNEVPHVAGTFLPVDDGASDPSFSAFREQLRGAVARRDTAAVLAVVADGARLSFGDDAGGPDGVRAMWFSGTPPGGESLWDVLGRILAAGSVVQDDALTVPYVFGAWPDSIDAFSHVAVVGDSVEARAAPSDTSAVVARVSHALLPADVPPAGGYRQVRLPGGAAAYVPEAAAMSPVDYRATFWKDGGAWKLQAFLAGD